VTESSLPPFPYTLVDLEEPERGALARVREADSLQWRLWVVKYAWFLSLLTAAPGIALIVWVVTANLPFALVITALAILAPGLVFWRQSRRVTAKF
jgi:hypothetical protein